MSQDYVVRGRFNVVNSDLGIQTVDEAGAYLESLGLTFNGQTGFGSMCKFIGIPADQMTEDVRTTLTDNGFQFAPTQR